MKMIKKGLSVLLTICIIVGLAPTMMQTVGADAISITLSEFEKKLSDYISNVYPDGSTYVANSSDRGYQCFGFANNMANYIFNSNPTGYSTGRIYDQNNWTITYGQSALNLLHVGDIVRFNFGNWDHSIFVTAINGSTITYSDANRDWKNGVKHNNNIEYSTLSSYISKLLNDSADVSGD